jgi:hypothetical protein
MVKQTGGRIGEDGLMNFSPFLFDFIEREPASVALFEKEFATIVLGKARKVDLGYLPSLHRMVVHNLAELYLLESESGGKGLHRSVVVRHRGPGTKPLIPVPLLSEAYLKKTRDERAGRSSTEHRSLLVWVPQRESQRSSSEVADRVSAELRAHAGGFKIVGNERVPDSFGQIGVRVEFSTRERLEAAKSSLLSKPGVVVGDITESSLSGPSSRSKESEGRSKVSRASESAWLEESSCLLRAQTSAGGAGPNAETRSPEKVPENYKPVPDDVPDSWEEAWVAIQRVHIWSSISERIWIWDRLQGIRILATIIGAIRATTFLSGQRRWLIVVLLQSI